MSYGQFLLMNLWRRAARLPELEAPPRVEMSAQWSPEFESLMRNRLIVGAFRYGAIGSQGKKQYDRTGAIAKRIAEYERTGNLELLVDVANLALLEYIESARVDRHFASVDDGEHVSAR